MNKIQLLNRIGRYCVYKWDNSLVYKIVGARFEKTISLACKSTQDSKRHVKNLYKNGMISREAYRFYQEGITGCVNDTNDVCKSMSIYPVYECMCVRDGAGVYPVEDRTVEVHGVNDMILLKEDFYVE
ncbi:MAG: hypothetical protein KBT06_04320 [Prevotellaceae bacterium]|nr:hypothetical protein [Candidatus Colivivens equi]